MKKAFVQLLFLLFIISSITCIASSLTLIDIAINTQDQFTIISFTFDMEADIGFRTYTLSDPERLYFDLAGTDRVVELTRLYVNDERIKIIRLGKEAPLRIVFEIDNFRASALKTDYKFVSNNMYFIIADPAYTIDINNIIDKYILNTKPKEEDILQDPFAVFDPEDEPSTIIEEEYKAEESIQMKVEQETKSFYPIAFLPEPVNNFLFTEIFPNFYVLYAILLALLLIIVLLAVRRKKRKHASYDSKESYYDSADIDYSEDTEKETSSFEQFLDQSSQKISRDLDSAEEDYAHEFEQDYKPSLEDEDEELEAAEVIDDEEADTEEPFPSEPISEQKKYDDITGDKDIAIMPGEGFDEKNMQEDIESSLEMFDKAKDNVSNEDDKEILIRLDEKELSKRAAEESLSESFRYYPLKVGNGWVWKYKNSLRKRMIIGMKELEGKGEVYKVKETVRIGEHKKQTIWYIYKSNKGIIEKADQYKKKVLAFPIRMNKKWEDDANNYEIISMDETINNYENCLKIMVLPKDIPVKRYIYFKKDIGLIMDEAKEELIKYKIDDKEYSF